MPVSRKTLVFHVHLLKLLNNKKVLAKAAKKAGRGFWRKKMKTNGPGRS